MNRRAAKYRCLACGNEWDGLAGPQSFERYPGQPNPPACPRCSSVYVEWKDFDCSTLMNGVPEPGTMGRQRMMQRLELTRETHRAIAYRPYERKEAG